MWYNITLQFLFKTLFIIRLYTWRKGYSDLSSPWITNYFQLGPWKTLSIVTRLPLKILNVVIRWILPQNSKVYLLIVSILRPIELLRNGGQGRHTYLHSCNIKKGENLLLWNGKPADVHTNYNQSISQLAICLVSIPEACRRINGLSISCWQE